MSLFYKNYINKIVNYDLLNKFEFKSIHKLPVLVEIILKFDFNRYDYDLLIRSLMILELLSEKNSIIIKSKKSNLTLKIKKGLPVGCKVILKKKKALNFIMFLINNKKLIENNYKIIKNNKGYTINLFNFNILNLSKFQSNYHFFKNSAKLSITFVTTSKNYKEFIYLLNSYKF